VISAVHRRNKSYKLPGECGLLPQSPGQKASFLLAWKPERQLDTGKFDG
jgi:hypothetical protein